MVQPAADVPEVLVVLAPEHRDRALAAIAGIGGVVTQVLSPRLVLVTGADAGRLRELPGVVAGYPDRVPADLAEPPADLAGEPVTEAERVFLDAWRARRAPKVRPGDGLDWDAPGYQPPD